MSNDYLEYSFVCSEEESEIITALICDFGFESFIYEDQNLKAYIKIVNEQMIDQLFNSVTHALQELNKHFPIKVQLIKSENWNQTWEKQFDPIMIDQLCVVRAPFHESVHGVLNIIIEPKMSFGTGHHQTTFMILSRIFDLDIHNKSVLDMGCGTGVLAITCEKRGASRVLGIDIEEWAYENSIENKNINHCQLSEFRLGGFEQINNEKFDLVIANINRNILTSNMSNLVSALKSNGKLILSGFFDVDVALLLDSAQIHGLMKSAVIQKDEWAMIELISK